MVVRPKQCEVADAQGSYQQGVMVWVDTCASSNLISPKLLDLLGLLPEPSAERWFKTVIGEFKVDQSVELNWKGRERKAASTFYVLPRGSDMPGLLVGAHFIHNFGEEVFADLPGRDPIYLTVSDKVSVSRHPAIFQWVKDLRGRRANACSQDTEKKQMNALKAKSDEEAKRLEEKRARGTKKDQSKRQGNAERRREG